MYQIQQPYINQSNDILVPYLLIKSSTMFALLLLRLRVKQKALQLLFYFFLSFLLVSVFRRTVKSFLATFYHLLPSKCVSRSGLFHWTNLKKVFIRLILKFLFETRVAYDLPSEKILMPEVSGHIESGIFSICSKITVYARMFIFSLPQCLWLSNLTGWWNTMRGSYP